MPQWHVDSDKLIVKAHRIAQQDEFDARDGVHGVWPWHHASDGIAVGRRRCEPVGSTLTIRAAGWTSAKSTSLAS